MVVQQSEIVKLTLQMVEHQPNCATCSLILEIGHVAFIEPETRTYNHMWCRREAIRRYRLRHPEKYVREVAELFNVGERTVLRSAPFQKHRTDKRYHNGV